MRFLSAMMTLIVALTVTACGKSPEKQVRSHLKNIVSEYRSYSKKLEKADDSDSVMKATKKFAVELDELNQRAIELKRKYPSVVSDRSKFKNEDKDIMEISMKLSGLMTKAIVTNMGDEDVQRAQHDMQRVIRNSR